MESIRGKQSPQIDASALAQRLTAYQRVLIDIGTGDGRFARHAAQHDPALFAIGVDACRENLRDSSRTLPPNALFIIANAQSLPRELWRTATHITINFPWGSLLAGLLDGDPALLEQLRGVARPAALLEVRVNESALAEAGWELEHGASRVAKVLRAAGFSMGDPGPLSPAELRTCPSTWAKRMAYGRKPHARYLRGKRI